MSPWVPSDRQCHSWLSTRGGIFIFILITLRGGRWSMAFSQNQTKPNLSWNFHFLFDHIQTSQEDNWLVDQWFWDFSDITLVYENYWMFSLLKCLTPETDLDASFFLQKYWQFFSLWYWCCWIISIYAELSALLCLMENLCWKISIVVVKFHHRNHPKTPPTTPRAFIWYINYGVPKRNFEI